jgi:hypothetical protein
LALQTRFKVATPRGRGRAPQIHVVTRSLGNRTFRLSGGGSHGFRIPLTYQGRLLLQVRGQLRTQLIASIPGGKRVHMLALRHRAG